MSKNERNFLNVPLILGTVKGRGDGNNRFVIPILMFFHRRRRLIDNKV